jgi:hypothetical protein
MSDRIRQKQKKLRDEEPSMQRDRTALGLSLVVHACAAGALVFLVHPIEPLADERMLVAVGPLTIVHRPPAPPIQRIVPAPRQTSLPRPIERPAPIREHPMHNLPRVLETAVVERVAVIDRNAPAAPATTQREIVAPQAITSTQASPAATPLASVPTAAPAPSVAPLHLTEAGEFASSYPPTPAAPELYNAIRANLASHVHAHVLVDERGRATAVEFLTASLDGTSTDELRQKLLALTYVPAECDGLACAGTFDVRI